MRDGKRSQVRQGGVKRLLKVAEWTLTAGLVIAFLGAGAARFLSPDSTMWWLQLLAVVLPQLGFVLVIIAIVAVLRREWGRAAISLTPLVLVLGLTHTNAKVERKGEYMQEAERTETMPLVVLSFNAKPEATAGKQDAFAELLSRERPHVVALQEFPVQMMGGRVGGGALLTPLLGGRAYEVLHPAVDGEARMSQPIFSRIESVSAAKLVPDNPKGLQQEGRWTSGGIARGLYRWNGQKVAVYNVHLHSFAGIRPWKEGWRRSLSPAAWKEALQAYRSDFRVRGDQARVLRRMLDAEPYPFILCADLNSTPHNWVYHYLARGLHDAFGVAGQGWGGTFPARFPLVRIDYVLVSKDWVVHKAHVDKAVASDHRPVVAELRLQPASSRAE